MTPTTRATLDKIQAERRALDNAKGEEALREIESNLGEQGAQDFLGWYGKATQRTDGSTQLRRIAVEQGVR